MDEEDDSSDKKDNNYYIKYPSTHTILISIIGLFILSFIIASFSLKNNKKFKISISFHEYLQLFSSGIFFIFSITNLFMENFRLNKYNNNNNDISINKYSNTYLILFLCLGYITNYFCENILLRKEITNNNFKNKYSSSFFRININKDKNDIDSIITGLNNNESLISNESIENSSPIENNLEKRYSTTEEKYFSILNNNNESIEKEKQIRLSYDFTKKNMNEKMNNIYIYENLINRNIENRIYDHFFIEKNIYSIRLILLFNLHKLCQGLYIGINSFEYKYFIFISFIIYYFVVIDSYYLGVTLSKFQFIKRETFIYIFINSFLYFSSAFIGLVLKLLSNELLGKIIKYFIVGTFLYSSLNILDGYFYHIDNDENKSRKYKNKYYFYFFTLGLILYICIFLYIK